jgi:hypothetical protein
MKKFGLIGMAIIGSAVLVVSAVNVSLNNKSSNKNSDVSKIALKNLEALTQESSGHTPGEWVTLGSPEEEIVKLGGECIRKVTTCKSFDCSPTGTAAYYCGAFREITDYIPTNEDNC